MPKHKKHQQLIVSFIGNTDLKFFPPNGNDISPILRLLTGLSGLGLSPAGTRLLLLDDDHEGSSGREDFCKKLKEQLTQLGLSGLQVQRQPITLPEGPTDLNALYEKVWAVIPTSGRNRADEIVFHITSGTPAMQLTLLLAAQCLPLDRWRLVETSREHGVREVRPAYVLAARERRLGERTVKQRVLSNKARKKMLPHTVVDDPQVKAAYAALHNAATNRKAPQRLVVQGPTGSGKWHAARQFAHWRNCKIVEWLEPAIVPEIPDGATILIRRLDTWPDTALKALTILTADRHDAAFVATFRTDQQPVVPLASLSRDGLRGAAHIELPSLGVRSDVVALGEALARQIGIHDGKLKQRLQYDLLTDLYPANLHDLKSLLATAAACSPGAHLEQKTYRQAKQLHDTHAILTEAWQILVGMNFGQGHPKLDDVLNVMRAAIVHRARAGRTGKEAGELLGISQQTVSRLSKQSLNLQRWRRQPDDIDDDEPL